VLSAPLCALTWAAWTGREDCRRVTGRLRAQPRGRLLARGTDLLALFGLTAVCMCVVLLPAGIGTPQVLWTVLCFSWCMAALALLLTGLSPQAGRVDTLAPFLALILCVLGGCFVDLSQLSPMLQRLAALTGETPPGLEKMQPGRQPIDRPGRGSVRGTAAQAYERAARLAQGGAQQQAAQNTPV